MAKLYITRGLPASGKSTWAKSKVSEGLGTIKRFSRDDFRAAFDNGVFSKKNEDFVTAIRDRAVGLALSTGIDAIIDDTNLNPKTLGHVKELATGQDEIEMVDFTDAPLETCIERDKNRTNQVGEKVIRDMYNRYLAPKNKTTKVDQGAKYPSEPECNKGDLRECIICDIDGTIAINNSGRSYFDYSRVMEDDPRWPVINVVKSLAGNSRRIFFLTGRDHAALDTTAVWLRKRAGLESIHPAWVLFSRAFGDKRRDSVIKRELYEKHIKDIYKVVAIFDDRPQVIKECWYELGFYDRTFNVGDGSEF